MSSAAFSFLSPVFLWALPVAAGLPVVVHWWTRWRAKPVPFAGLMFLPNQAAPATRLRRLDHRLLLAMRVLALTAFAAAFARPAWLGQAPEAPVGGRKVALVLDRTASMNQPEGLGTAFDAAKFEAGTLLAKLGAKDRVALVCADRACAPAWAGWLAPAEARERLGKLAPSWEAGDVGQAAQVAAAMEPTEIRVWTDRQGEAQCQADVAARSVGIGAEVRVVGHGNSNGWLKREKPEGLAANKPTVSVNGNGVAAKRFALALGPCLSGGRGDVVVREAQTGGWGISKWARGDDIGFSVGPDWDRFQTTGHRVIASADWSAPELAVFAGVSRAALIGCSLSDGEVLQVAPTDRILIRFDDGSPTLIARDQTYFLAGSPTGGAHPLADSPAFVPLVHELVKALLPPPLPAHPGDALDLPVPVGGRVLSPGGASVTARFGEPGVYRAVDANGQTTATRWCEVDAGEVDWERDAVSAQVFSHATSASIPTLATADRRAPMVPGTPTELWPFCVLLALLALLAEPLLVWHAGRKAQA